MNRAEDLRLDVHVEATPRHGFRPRSRIGLAPKLHERARLPAAQAHWHFEGQQPLLQPAVDGCLPEAELEIRYLVYGLKAHRPLETLSLRQHAHTPLKFDAGHL